MRIFQINEYGDINYDSENRTMSNIILDSKVESDFATSKTIIISYFKYKEILKYELKNKRNNFTDEELNEFFEINLDVAFEKYPVIRNFIFYEFVNEGKSLDVLFYFKNDLLKRHIMLHTITI